MTASLRRLLGFVCIAALSAAVLLLPATAHGAATIVILNNDSAGEGFNDPTPAAPVGGNSGTTLGLQRLIAFQHAASIWGATLTSSVTITIRANFDPLFCAETNATLGSAGPLTVHANFAGAPFTNFWYHAALANKLAGSDLSAANSDIGATFNSNLGQAGCLTGTPFYLGLDSNHGPAFDFVIVLLHEFAHGLGFSTVTNPSNGIQISGLPSIFDRFLFDTTQGLSWNNLTNAQRAASAINTGHLVWNGANVVGAVPTVISGTPELLATAPASLAASYPVGTATFGPALTASGLSGELMPVVDQGGGAACAAFNASNTLAVNGKIALIDRGVCGFSTKVKNAQNAGAIGVIIVNDVAGSLPPAMGGVDSTITIPSVSLTQAVGTTFKAALRFRSRTRSGVLVNMRLNAAILAGVDSSLRPFMYTPNPVQAGASVSHWDFSLTPNQLMEPPPPNGDLTQSVNVPQDLTFALLKDIGWN